MRTERPTVTTILSSDDVVMRGGTGHKMEMYQSQANKQVKIFRTLNFEVEVLALLSCLVVRLTRVPPFVAHLQHPLARGFERSFRVTSSHTCTFRISNLCPLFMERTLSAAGKSWYGVKSFIHRMLGVGTPDVTHSSTCVRFCFTSTIVSMSASSIRGGSEI